MAQKRDFKINTPIIGISGWKKSGKTTLTVRLIEEFTRRGLKVASVKHAHHDFQVDSADTDSARHRRAGADEVAIISGKRWAIVHELQDAPEPDFEDVISWLAPSDIIIVEGYKTAPIPKIEARRTASRTKRSLIDDDPNVIAIASDHDVEAVNVPVFDLDDIHAIADHIEASIGPLEARIGAKAQDTSKTHANVAAQTTPETNV